MSGDPALTLLCAILIAVGALGVVIPVLPGLLLCWGAVLLWALVEQSGPGWSALAAATLILLVTTVIKYLVPGRRMRASGVPWRSLALGALLGLIAGVFIIPVLGLFIGFVGGVWLAELIRLDDRSQAWPSTVAAIKGVGLSMLIEFVGAVMIAVAFGAAVIAS